MPNAREVHDWISFEDPDGGRMWIFDASYLLSNWKCIYGEGCKGIHEEDTTDQMQGCCSFGAHFIDKDDEKTVVRSARRLTAENWQYKARAAKTGWLGQERDGTPKTRVVDGACIFLNRPGFAGGTGCALHIGALAAGERPMDWKPDVCWQVPVRLQETFDEDGHVVTFVREWKRRDWGEGGHEFHWWCTSDPLAFVGREPTYKYLADELTELVGPKVYALLVKELEKRQRTVAAHPVTLTRKPRRG